MSMFAKKKMKLFLGFCTLLYGSVLMAFYLTHCIEEDDDLYGVSAYKEIDGEAERNTKMLEQLRGVVDAVERAKIREAYLESVRRVKRASEADAVTDVPPTCSLGRVDNCMLMRYCCFKCQDLLFQAWQEEMLNPERIPS